MEVCGENGAYYKVCKPSSTVVVRDLFVSARERHDPTGSRGLFARRYCVLCADIVAIVSRVNAATRDAMSTDRA